MKKNKNKIKNIEVQNARRAEAEALCRARRTSKLKAAGITDEQLKQLTEDENARSILCIYYGNYTVNIGMQKIKAKKYDKNVGQCKEVEIEKEIILRGRQAAEYFIREKDYNVIIYKPTHCYIATTADKAQEIASILQKDIGRCYITKHDNLTVQEVMLKFHPKTVQETKPTSNTNEVKAKAKKKRKNANIEKANMRPFYAAKRKGGVSQRIKKFNKPLAEKIEKWLEEERKRNNEKAEKSKEHRAQHRQLTSLEMKANKRARKAAKHLATQELRREREMKAMANNQAAHEKRAQEAAKHGKKAVQQKLNMPKEELKKAA